MKNLKGIMFIFAAIMLVLTLLLGVNTVTCAEKPIELTYATHYPPAHPYSRADSAWIAKIEKETNGRVKIKPYWGGLISRRDTVREVAKGVANIGFITPIYEKAGFDLTKECAAFFQGITDPRDTLRIYGKLWEEFPELRNETKDVKILCIHASGPMHLLTTNKPVRELKDLRGLRMKAPPELIGPLKELGAEGVQMPMSEAYTSLQKGIIKGVWAPYETLKSFRFAEVCKYYNKIPMSRGAYPSRAMNWDTWNKLPADIQKAFDDNRDFWAQQVIVESDKAQEAGRLFGVEQGVEFIDVPKEEVDKWWDMLEVGAVETAKKFDAKGLPGTKMYNVARPLVKATFKK